MWPSWEAHNMTVQWSSPNHIPLPIHISVFSLPCLNFSRYPLLTFFTYVWHYPLGHISAISVFITKHPSVKQPFFLLIVNLSLHSPISVLLRSFLISMLSTLLSLNNCTPSVSQSSQYFPFLNALSSFASLTAILYLKVYSSSISQSLQPFSSLSGYSYSCQLLLSPSESFYLRRITDSHFLKHHRHGDILHLVGGQLRRFWF